MTWRTVGLQSPLQISFGGSSLTEDGGFGDGWGDGEGDGDGEGPGWEISSTGFGDGMTSGHYGHNNGDGESAQ
jgi:hypothetical protein